MRLVMLLGVLMLGFFGVAALRPPAPVERSAQAQIAAPLPAAAEVSRADTAAETRGLPPTVRRLADSPVTGPARPTILPEAVIDPSAVQPMTAARATAGLTQNPSTGQFGRVVAASVNVRGGPSTGHSVIGRLTRNEEVEVLEASGSGWLRVRIQGDGVEGWVAARLVAQ